GLRPRGPARQFVFLERGRSHPPVFGAAPGWDARHRRPPPPPHQGCGGRGGGGGDRRPGGLRVRGRPAPGAVGRRPGGGCRRRRRRLSDQPIARRPNGPTIRSLNGRTPRRLVAPLGDHAIVGTGADTAAASVLLRDLIAGSLCPAKVLAVGPAATYMEARGQVLAIVAAGGVRVPGALMLAGGGRLPASRSGSGLAVGRGAVYEDGRQLVVVRRWFDPRVRLAGVDGRAVAR